jgi:hypothetical protein
MVIYGDEWEHFMARYIADEVYFGRINTGVKQVLEWTFLSIDEGEDLDEVFLGMMQDDKERNTAVKSLDTIIYTALITTCKAYRYDIERRFPAVDVDYHESRSNQ